MNTFDVHAFVTSQVDYCGSLLTGTAKKLTDKLQHVLNSAAWIVSNTHKFDWGLAHFQRSELHWLEWRCRPGSVQSLHSGICTTCLLDTCGPAFAYIKPSNWNSLPDHLRDNSLSLSTFKTFVFSFYYYYMFSTTVTHSGNSPSGSVVKCWLQWFLCRLKFLLFYSYFLHFLL